VLVFVEDAAEAVMSVDVQVGQSAWIGDWFRQRGKWSRVPNALVRPVGVVVRLECAQRVQQMSLVVDQRVVQELAPAGSHPPFHDRVTPYRQLRLSATMRDELSV
jgi:hypothetical protein